MIAIDLTELALTEETSLQSGPSTLGGLVCGLGCGGFICGVGCGYM